MTGYGKTIIAYNGKKINIEVKSLNSKQLDLSTRIAPLYRDAYFAISNVRATETLKGLLPGAEKWVEIAAPADATLLHIVSDCILPGQEIEFQANTEGPTGIRQLSAAEESPAEPVYYNLAGQRMAKPTKGVVILRQNGQSRRVTIK